MPLDLTMAPELLFHQLQAADFLASNATALLADEAGSGKTGASVRACDLVGARRVLVACPAAVRSTGSWNSRSGATRRSSVKCLWFRTSSIALASEADLARARFDVILLDELHRLRSFDAKRTARVFGTNGLCMRRTYCWLLSGSPLVNSASDVFPFYHGGCLRAGVVPMGWLDFVTRFTSLVDDPWNGVRPVGLRNAPELAAMLRRVFLRRTLPEVGVYLPPLDATRLDVALPEGAIADILAGLDNWTPEKLAEALELRDEIRDAAIMRARRALGLAKAPLVVPLIEKARKPVVVFYVHRDVRDCFLGCFPAAPVIDGQTGRKRLGVILDEFAKGLHEVLLVQMQAGGVGLTLTRARDILIAELPWTAADLWQCIKRVHRITQRSDVRATSVVAPDCWLDRVLVSTIERKQRASDGFLELLKNG